MDSAAVLLQTSRMKLRAHLCLLAAAAFSGCAPSGINEGPKPPPAAAEWAPSNPAQIDFQAFVIPGGLEINEDGKPVSRLRPAQPVLERWAFVKDGRQIIVKSRGAEGPPTIELFDSRTAVRRDSIPADQVIDGRPAWAAGMAETVR
jgi:hypothetical protein